MSPTSAAANVEQEPTQCLQHGRSKAEFEAAHGALKADDARWQSLAFAGIQHDGRGGLAEPRQCPACQSTLARPVTPDEALHLCQLQAALQERSMQAVTAALASSPSQTRVPPMDSDDATHASVRSRKGASQNV